MYPRERNRRARSCPLSRRTYAPAWTRNRGEFFGIGRAAFPASGFGTVTARSEAVDEVMPRETGWTCVVSGVGEGAGEGASGGAVEGTGAGVREGAGAGAREGVGAGAGEGTGEGTGGGAVASSGAGGEEISVAVGGGCGAIM